MQEFSRASKRLISIMSHFKKQVLSFILLRSIYKFEIKFKLFKTFTMVGTSEAVADRQVLVIERISSRYSCCTGVIDQK